MQKAFKRCDRFKGCHGKLKVSTMVRTRNGSPGIEDDHPVWVLLIDLDVLYSLPRGGNNFHKIVTSNIHF